MIVISPVNNDSVTFSSQSSYYSCLFIIYNNMLYISCVVQRCLLSCLKGNEFKVCLLNIKYAVSFFWKTFTELRRISSILNFQRVFSLIGVDLYQILFLHQLKKIIFSFYLFNTGNNIDKFLLYWTILAIIGNPTWS